MATKKHVDWTVKQFCLSCDSEMRSQTNKLSRLVAHEKHGLCRRCANRKSVGIVFDASGQVCFKCKEYKSFDSFTKSKDCLSGHNSTCKQCKILWIHGIDRVTFNNLLSSQGDKCAICRKGFEDFPGNWHVDHDHACCGTRGKKSCGNCVRGILCGPCNSGIGMLQDDPEILISAAKYLEKTKHKENNVRSI